jgi:SpoIID/LytB domain protein
MPFCVAGAEVTTRGETMQTTLWRTRAKFEPRSAVGKITRHYHGTLEIKPSGGALTALVAMDLETAVASAVAAESTPDTPLEALKAQAIAARSYFVASRGRHLDFDFCDTTHCQFLREPPVPDSAVANAAEATRGLVLAHDSQPFAAMYTRSCSGRTRTPAELGLPSAAYPYYSVQCEYCRSHPVRWSSRISARDAAAVHSSDESTRLDTIAASAGTRFRATTSA